jgi:hypothetical protein
MIFGVQQAIETQNQVERAVVVPRDAKPISTPSRGTERREYTEEDLGI